MSSNDIVVPADPLNADGILDLLNDEGDDNEQGRLDEGKDGKKDKEGSDKDDPDAGDGKEKEDEIELVDEKDEEQPEDEDIDIVAPVAFKNIEKEFPGLDKKFPQLKAAYYKSQQYGEVFPSVDDAKEAAEKASQLDQFSADILDGNLEKLFQTVKTQAPKSLGKIADNLIATIGKVDESVALHITGNILRTILLKSERDGLKSKNEDLQTAAKIINAHIFGDDEIQNPSRLAPEQKENEEETKLKNERAAFEEERFNSTLSALQTRVDNSIKATIDANIDKPGTMSRYVKINAVRDAHKIVEDKLNGDKAFQNILNNLWRSAKDAKYSTSSVEKIRSAYLSKAKTVLRDAIRTARNEALKDSGKSNSGNENKRGPLPVHRAASGSNENRGKVKEIPKGMSTKDFIMAD